MKLAFQTKRLRQICESQLVAEEVLGLVVAKSLRSRLADLESARSVCDLVLGNPVEMDFGILQIELGGGVSMRIEVNHQKTPVCSDDSIDWKKVSRLKITWIGNTNYD